MSFQVKEPVLLIGLGGAGSKLAMDAKEALNSDCMIIGNDAKDFKPGVTSVHVSTESVINPSVQLIRGSTTARSNQRQNQWLFNSSNDEQPCRQNRLSHCPSSF